MPLSISEYCSARRGEHGFVVVVVVVVCDVVVVGECGVVVVVVVVVLVVLPLIHRYKAVVCQGTGSITPGVEDYLRRAKKQNKDNA